MTTVDGFSDGMVVLILATNGKNQICSSSKKQDCGRSSDNNGFLSKWAAMEMQKVRIGMDWKISGFDAPAFQANNP
jgi:hypothetical protein